MLIEVVDEKPADVPTNQGSSTEQEILAHLVTHYADKVYIPIERSVPYFEDIDNDNGMKDMPTVVKYCREKLLLQMQQEHPTGETMDAPSTTTARRELPEGTTSTIRNLLYLYATEVRPKLFDNTQSIHSTGVAVLYHYEWLLSSLCESCARPMVAEPDGSSAVLEVSINRSRSSFETTKQTNVLQKLLRDTTLCQNELMQLHLSEDTARRWLLQHYVLSTLLRLLQKVFMFQKAPFSDAVVETCAARFLAWSSPHVEPPLIAPTLRRALSLTEMATSVPKEYAPRQVTGLPPWCGLDWNSALVWEANDWQSAAAVRAVEACWKLLRPANVAQQGHKALLGHFGWDNMAAAIRRYFFGKDDVNEDEDNALSAQRTRLHLGRTVPQEPVEYEKPYRAVPARMHAAFVFISLIDKLSTSMLQDLAPILYELLAATQEEIQALGAACLCHLLDISKDQNFVWPPIVLSNLYTALNLTVQTCRKGPVVAVLGVAQATLLHRFAPNEMLQLRRKATQQWLMILQKNLHNAELVWGILVGSVIRLGADLVRGQDEGIELGRLALSCLLPLIRRDDGTSSGSTGGVLAEEIQWLALVAVVHWLVAAHAVIIRHDGKLLGSLLLCLGRINDGSSITFVWAKHAAAMVIVATHFSDSGNCLPHQGGPPLRSAKIEKIIDSGSFQESLVTIGGEVLDEARALLDRLE